MKTYKALVKDRQSGRYTEITSEYKTQTAFRNDLRANGYIIRLAKEIGLYEYIVKNTNIDDIDKRLRTKPENDEDYRRMRQEIIRADFERIITK